MLERILIALALVSMGWFAFHLFKRIQLGRHGSRTLGLPGYKAGVATIVYFTTPGCVPCKTVQQPALASLMERFGEAVNVIQLDASEQPGLADSWGVLSVPTTFLIDPQGRPRGVNHGVARAGKLFDQMAAIGVKPPAGLHSGQSRLAPSRDG